MKLLCIFLSAMILSLASLPCCGEEDHCDEEIQLCENESDHSSENQESGQPCLPFFSCGSCTGFSLTLGYFFKINLSLAEQDKLIDSIQSGIPQNFQLSLFKPPKQI